MNGQSNIAVLADSESQLCKIFHNAVPTANLDTTQKLCSLFSYISLHASEDSLKKIRNDLKEISVEVLNIESRFISDMMKYTVQGFDPTATGWSALKSNATLRTKFLTFLGSRDSLRLLARTFAIKSYILLGKSPEQASLDEMGKFFLDRFETPLRLYNEIVRRIVMSGCDLSKNNRGNWIWDIQVAFNIGSHSLAERDLRVVTSDGDILKAAQDANCGSSVFSLKDYLDRLDSGTVT